MYQLHALPENCIPGFELIVQCMVIVDVRHLTNRIHKCGVWQLQEIASCRLPMHSHKSVASYMYPDLPLNLTFETLRV